MDKKDYTKKYIEMISELQELNSTISSVSLEVMKLSEEINGIDSLIEQKSQEEMFGISRAMDEKGKALFTNAEMRQSELARRLSISTDYETIQTARKQKISKKMELQIREAELIRTWEMMMKFAGR